VGNNEDYGRSMRPGAEDRRWSSTGRVLGDWTIERSGDVVCGLHHAQGNEKREFLYSASKQRSMVCQWFSIKTTRMVCQWFDLKTIGTVSPGLASKLVALGFSVEVSKPAGMVW
jgi:hypothetical protein